MLKTTSNLPWSYQASVQSECERVPLFSTSLITFVSGSLNFQITARFKHHWNLPISIYLLQTYILFLVFYSLLLLILSSPLTHTRSVWHPPTRTIPELHPPTRIVLAWHPPTHTVLAWYPPTRTGSAWHPPTRTVSPTYLHWISVAPTNPHFTSMEPTNPQWISVASTNP